MPDSASVAAAHVTDSAVVEIPVALIVAGAIGDVVSSL